MAFRVVPNNPRFEPGTRSGESDALHADAINFDVR